RRKRARNDLHVAVDQEADFALWRDPVDELVPGIGLVTHREGHRDYVRARCGIAAYDSFGRIGAPVDQHENANWMLACRQNAGQPPFDQLLLVVGEDADGPDQDRTLMHQAGGLSGLW